MEQENQYLKERIAFLEALIDVQTETLEKAIATNAKLINYLKETI
ncbi:hypothetical protein IGI37_002099 [Enterococcus sp. AZ194]